MLIIMQKICINDIKNIQNIKYLLLLQRKNPKLMLRILFLVLGVGVEPTKAEAGRFTV